MCSFAKKCHFVNTVQRLTVTHTPSNATHKTLKGAWLRHRFFNLCVTVNVPSVHNYSDFLKHPSETTYRQTIPYAFLSSSEVTFQSPAKA